MTTCAMSPSNRVSRLLSATDSTHPLSASAPHIPTDTGMCVMSALTGTTAAGRLPDATCVTLGVQTMSDNYATIDVEAIANNADDDVTPGDVQAELDLLNQMHIPAAEAEQSVRKKFDAVDNTDGLVSLAEAADGRWTSHRVRVQAMIPNDHPSIAYTFRVADETGTERKVTVFTGDFPNRDHDPEQNPLFKPGDLLEIDGAIGEEYNGKVTLILRETTNVEFLAEGALDVPENAGDETVTAVIVQVQDGSGLVKRCPVEGCNRVITNGRCPEHGPVDQLDGEPEFDMRLKLVVNTGAETFQAIVNDDPHIEALTGYTVEQAQSEAMEALDTSVVLKSIRADLPGSVVELTGAPIDDRFVVNDISVGDFSAADLGATTSVADSEYTPRHAAPRLPTELARIDSEYKDGDGEKSPVRAEPPAAFGGPDLNRVLVAGALTEIDNVADGDEPYLRGKLVDAAGNSVKLFAGKYQPEVRSDLQNMQAPESVLVVGKPRTYTADGEVRFKIDPETVAPIESDIREMFSSFAARDALDRLNNGADDSLETDLNRIVTKLSGDTVAPTQ